MKYKLLFTCAFLLAAQAVHANAPSAGDLRRAAALQARHAVGVPYHYGGASPETGFDCSGLVTHVYERAWGLALPRNTEGQRHVGHAVKRSHLLPGDLVFYNTRGRPFSHVGIYLGNGDFVHAPRRGERVRIERIDSPYWRARFSGARRLDPARSRSSGE